MEERERERERERASKLVVNDLQISGRELGGDLHRDGDGPVRIECVIVEPNNSRVTRYNHTMKWVREIIIKNKIRGGFNTNPASRFDMNDVYE